MSKERKGNNDKLVGDEHAHVPTGQVAYNELWKESLRLTSLDDSCDESEYFF